MALTKPARICACRFRIKPGDLCPCEKQRKAQADASRPTARQRGYTREWEKARAEFLKVHPFCAMCGNRATVVDHIKPHRSDDRLFWDRSNWQPLCTPCHNKRKQRQEKGRTFKRLGGGPKLSSTAEGPARGPSREFFPNRTGEKEGAT